MIRKNVAGQVVTLPQLALTADGTAVTSSASVTVVKDGTSSAGGGTLTHVSNGVWTYGPTQAETNCAILGLILTATSATPVVVNLVTTAADTTATAFGAYTGTPPTAAAIADAVWDEVQSGHTTSGTFGKYLDAQVSLVGGGSVTLMPLTGVVETRAMGTRIPLFVGEGQDVTITCVDAAGEDVDLTGLTLEIVFETRKREDVAVIADGDITVSTSSFTFTVPSAVTQYERALRWVLRNTADESVLMHGIADVQWAPKAD